jgi:acetyltransferase-like isoleucine patch superfamily enzyme
VLRNQPTIVARLRSKATSGIVRIGYFMGPRILSELRKWWVVVRNPQVKIIFGKGTFIGPRFSLHAPHGGTFITGEHVEFRRGFRAELGGPESRIEIGPYSVCTYDVLMQCGTSIVLGVGAMLGQCTLVVDGNHRFRDLSQPMLAQGYDYRPIHIADGAIITTKCTVIADVGERSFVGANSVVSRAIPAYSLAVGAPARTIDYFGPPGHHSEELSGANSERSG